MSIKKNDNHNLVKKDETVDEFFEGQLKILQKEKGYRFSVDAFLLSHFTDLGPRDRVIDLGTGSGVISLILACRYPSVNALGVEIQEELADMARRSAMLNKLDQRVKMQVGDVKNIKKNFEPQSFDAVVFNPPYRRLNAGRINPNHEKAVARHEIKGTIHEFLTAAKYLLKDGGSVSVIYPASRGIELLVSMRNNGIEPKKIRVVYSNCHSSAEFCLVRGIKKGGEELEIMPPFFIYKDEGTYSDEMKGVFNALSLFQ